MAFVQAVNEDGSLMKDKEGNPILIPMMLKSDDKDQAEISAGNEVPTWDKMSIEQKIQY